MFRQPSSISKFKEKINFCFHTVICLLCSLLVLASGREPKNVEQKVKKRTIFKNVSNK